MIEKIWRSGRQEHTNKVSLVQEVSQASSLEAKGDNTEHQDHIFSFEDRVRIYKSNATLE